MKNDFKVGDKLYWYTAKDSKFIVHEGEIIELRNRLFVYFEDNHSRRRVPKNDEFGIIQNGTNIWLAERDDKLAKSIFLKLHEECLSKLQKQIDNKIKFIELLKESE